MRWTLISFLCIVTINSALGQRILSDDMAAPSNAINIASPEVQQVFIQAPESAMRLKSGKTSATRINVEYVDFPDEAKRAFEYAVSIWETQINSSVPINIKAKWESFDVNYLATSGPSINLKNFEGAQVKDVYYPIALAEKLAGKELNTPGDADIICEVNKNVSWYFGTDGKTPANQYDFVTAILHEITHGLGFTGYLQDNNEDGFINNDSQLPSIYDYLIVNSSVQRISDPSVFSRPSKELHQQLTSSDLWHLNENTEAQKQLSSNIYAPAKWNNGASIYHLDENAYPAGSENSLMTAFLKKGEAIHNPGPATIEILSDMGWKSLSFMFSKIKDIEKPCDRLPVQIGLESDLPIDSSSVKIIYSTDYFNSTNEVELNYNASNNRFTGEIELNQRIGNVQYFIKACSKNNKQFSYPSDAPAKKLTFNVGPDYYAPEITHNPVKLVSAAEKNIKIDAIVNDNVGVQSVVLEYKIDGVDQEPVVLKSRSENVYESLINFPTDLKGTEKIEYRIVATDNSEKHNKNTDPAKGYFTAQVFNAYQPVGNYQNSFNSATSDFIGIDFSVEQPAGFDSGILHTATPYPTSKINNEKINLIAQLKYPVILEDNGQMSFDEVVLVEPGEESADYTDDIFWDYVIVEGSKDFGQTWQPLVNGYDSGIDDLWYSEFNRSMINNSSVTKGNESMFATRTINLTNGTGFSAGDTVVFRFRLASDKMINGWGWAIDNLEIQTLASDTEELLTEDNINIYPNPCSNNIYVDCSNVSDIASVDIAITDLFGKTVLREPWLDVRNNPRKNIQFSDLRTGIYLVNVTIGDSRTITKKIIKQ